MDRPLSNQPDIMSENQSRYLKAHRRHHHLISLFRLLLIVLFLGLWELAGRKQWIDVFFFSSPGSIVLYLYQMLLDYSFFTHTGITLLETVVSFLLVTIISLLAATLLWYINSLAEILEPYLVILNSLPKSALAPLLIVWLGTGTNTIIVAGISVAVFGSVISLYTGFRQADPEMLKLIYTLGGNRRDALFKVILPSSVPLILSTMKVNIGLSLVGVIIGEFLAARRGLGYLIIYGSQVFRQNAEMTERKKGRPASGLSCKLLRLMDSQRFSRDRTDPALFKELCQPLRIRHTEDHARLPVLLPEYRVHVFHVDFCP